MIITAINPGILNRNTREESDPGTGSIQDSVKKTPKRLLTEAVLKEHLAYGENHENTRHSFQQNRGAFFYEKPYRPKSLQYTGNIALNWDHSERQSLYRPKGSITNGITSTCRKKSTL